MALSNAEFALVTAKFAVLRAFVALVNAAFALVTARFAILTLEKADDVATLALWTTIWIVEVAESCADLMPSPLLVMNERTQI